MTKRKIIEIDPERCNGCGSCIAACAEGALALVSGKAQLTGDVYCDGLGACIGDCPTGAITVTEREAPPFDATADRPGPHTRAPHGKDRPSDHAPSPTLACGCPGSHEMTLPRAGTRAAHETSAPGRPSQLTHWPIKLRLLNPAAPYLAGADLLLLADCAAAACPNLHDRLLRDRCVALACPKFDDVDFSFHRLTDIIREASPASITVAYMEVPCCHGLSVIAQRAVAKSGVDVPVGHVILARTGEFLSERGPIADGTTTRAAGAI
jgi:ferredoxin